MRYTVTFYNEKSPDVLHNADTLKFTDRVAAVAVIAEKIKSDRGVSMARIEVFEDQYNFCSVHYWVRDRDRDRLPDIP